MHIKDFILIKYGPITAILILIIVGFIALGVILVNPLIFLVLTPITLVLLLFLITIKRKGEN